ncbi:MAG TPA: molybdenum cofactor guanylyltransferase [Candidatus Tumulicola sp.]
MSARLAAPAIVILAGGRATRFPGKLERTIDGEPMLLRTYRNARATGWPVYLAGNGSIAVELAARIDAPVLTDRWPGAGPLRAFLSACAMIADERAFALAADEPRVDRRLLEAVNAAWQAGDEAVVPEHDGRIEPLAALYLRAAVLREGAATIERGNESMHGLIERTKARRVSVSPSYFVNVNTPEDLRHAARMSH